MVDIIAKVRTQDDEVIRREYQGDCSPNAGTDGTRSRRGCPVKVSGRGMAPRAVLLISMFVAPRQGAAATGDRQEPDLGAASKNVKEVAHQVRVTIGPSGWARATVTRTFEARQPGSPVALYRDMDLPRGAVVTSFALDTNGRWRSGRLRPRHRRGGRRTERRGTRLDRGSSPGGNEMGDRGPGPGRDVLFRANARFALAAGRIDRPRGRAGRGRLRDLDRKERAGRSGGAGPARPETRLAGPGGTDRAARRGPWR